jgi:hypothetical protein
VRHEKHIHQHQHVHIEGGVREDDRQAHGAVGERAGGNGAGPPLLGNEPSGTILSLPCRSGEAGMPIPRGRKRIRSANG